MKTKLYTWAFGICLSLGLCASQASAQILPAWEGRKLQLQEIGATVGIGISNIHPKELNSRLQALEIGDFDQGMVSYNVSLYMGFRNGFGLSADVNGGSTIGGIVINSATYINLNTVAFGPTVYYSLLRGNRVRLQAMGGMRHNLMNFHYNSNNLISSSFDDLLTNPGANSQVVVLESYDAAKSALLGARFRYRLGQKENLEAGEYSIGIDTGYNHSLDTINWREMHSRALVRDMPAVKPSYFYMNLTVSAHLYR